MIGIGCCFILGSYYTSNPFMFQTVGGVSFFIFPYLCISGVARAGIGGPMWRQQESQTCFSGTSFAEYTVG